MIRDRSKREGTQGESDPSRTPEPESSAEAQTAAEETRAERVARIRSELASGTYRIGTDQLANKVMGDMLTRGGRARPHLVSKRKSGSSS
jgi:anti-sigma28 factor (negative regulator of flagellin synthesis)